MNAIMECFRVLLGRKTKTGQARVTSGLHAHIRRFARGLRNPLAAARGVCLWLALFAVASMPVLACPYKAIVLNFSNDRSPIYILEGTDLNVAGFVECGGDCVICDTQDSQMYCTSSSVFTYGASVDGAAGQALSPASVQIASGVYNSWIGFPTMHAVENTGYTGNRTGTLRLGGSQLPAPSCPDIVRNWVTERTVCIIDKQAYQIGVVCNTPNVLEGQKGTFTVYRTYNSNKPDDLNARITVQLRIAAQTTASPSDYTINLNVTMEPGQASVPVTVDVAQDALQEANETLRVEVVGTPFAVDPAHPWAEMTIIDDTAVVNVEMLTPNGFPSSSTGEGYPASLHIWREQAYEQSAAVAVTYNVVDTATPGSDYPTLSGKATIKKGTFDAYVKLDPFLDRTTEGPETVTVSLPASTKYAIGTHNSATLTILDNSSTVGVQFLQPYVQEGQTATLRFFRTVNNGGVNGIPEMLVKYKTTGSAKNGTDYKPTLKGTIVFPEGALEVLTNLTTVVDSTKMTEGPETIKIDLLPTTPQSYTIDTSSNATLLLYNSTPVVSVYAVDTNANESADTALFRVMRSGDTKTSLTIKYSVSGSANNGGDIAFMSNSIVIPAGETYGHLTVAALADVLTEPTETVVVTLLADTAKTYQLSTAVSATAYVSDYVDSSREVPNPSSGISSLASNDRFSRGTGTDPAYQSFVVPVDLEQGIPLGLTGSNGAAFFNGIGWDTRYHYNRVTPGSPLAFQNPIAAFGSRVGGSALYYDQNYTFGIYAGDPMPSYTNANALADALRIQVYNATTFAFVDTVTISIPNILNTNEWTAFLTNGYSKAVSAYGLTTVLTFNNFDWAWDTSTTDGRSLDVAYHLSHRADSHTNKYIYVVEFAGGTEQGGWMATTAAGARSWSRLYTMEFEARPIWRTVVAQQPNFFGEPLPPGYAGRSAEELLTNGPPVTNPVVLANPAVSYTNLDASPELRRHPVLDRFVTDMGNDPILLANYVLNEIDLTDGIDYNDNGAIDDVSINLGGVNRGALGTFLEGQGSPTEQCALLVYLLRQAGVPAVYCFPPTNGLKMVDSRMSKLLRMQIRGAVDSDGTTYTTNRLIAVNYPWVAAYLTNESRWIHIFPWLKDTEVQEGFNLYDYMPPQYDNAFKWAKAFMYGDTNILSLSPDDDSPLILYPRFLERALRENAPGISMDDLGIKAWNRRHYYARWSDFPTPTSVVSSNIAVESLGSSSITNVSPFMTNIFNTVSIEVCSLANTNKKVSSGELRMAELHNRRLVVWHDRLSSTQHRLNLGLAAFRPDTSTSKPFSTADLNGTGNTNVVYNLTANTTLDQTDEQLQLTVIHKRHRSLPSGFIPPYFWSPYLGLGSSTSTTVTRFLTKGDLAGICMNVGQVSRKMLDQHANDIWQIQRSGATSADMFQYQGSVAYLMGMSWFQKVSEFDQLVARLHKVQTLSEFSAGLSLLHAQHDAFGNLPDGNIILNRPTVDMIAQQVVQIGNGSAHLDSGDDGYGPVFRVMELATVGDSALEHWIINQFFQQSDAVSTVRLLRLAKRNSAIVELNRTNYVAEGEKLYNGAKLKDADPGVWSTLTNAFASSYVSNNVQAYMTPGKIRSDSGFYYGVGAMVFGAGEWIAMIANGANGGDGPPIDPPIINNPSEADLTVSGNNFQMTQFQFLQNPNGTFSVLPSSAPAVFDLPSTLAGINNNTLLDPVLLNSMQFSSDIYGTGSSSPYLNYLYMQNFGAMPPAYEPDALDWVFDPVNAVTGEFFVDATDLILPGPMPLAVRRNYSSQNSFDNDFGYGWKCSYMPYITVSADKNNAEISAADPDGSVLIYRRQNNTTNVWSPTSKDNPRVVNLSGSSGNPFNSSITRTTNSSIVTYTMRRGDGSVRVYKENSFPIGSSAVTRKRPYLDTWTDSCGNYFKFTYGTDSTSTDYGKVRRVESSNGNFLGFYYDVFGHIVEAYSGDGRRLQYEYDDFGDLIRVEFPDASEFHYEYMHDVVVKGAIREPYSTHLLIRELKPDDRVLKNDYDSERRVINQYSTVGPDLRILRNASFEYHNNFKFAKILTTKIDGYTLVKDCFNNSSRFEYTDGLITRTLDPIGGETKQTWYTTKDTKGAFPGSIKSMIDKRGLTSVCKYDASGNATNITLIGDITGSGSTNETAVTLMRYDSNNLVTNIVDAVTNRTAYTYTNSISPFLKTTEERYAADGTPIATTVFSYYNVLNPAPQNNYVGAFGLLQQLVRAYGSSDAATNVWAHDPHGFVTNSIRFTGTTDPAITNSFFYNLRGELIEQTDAAGRTTGYSYDGQGRVQWVEVFDELTNRLSGSYSYYNLNGELTWSDGPRSNPEDYVWRDYDGAGRVVQEVRWRSRAKSDGSGVEAETGDNLYSTTFREYDPFGNLVKSIDPRGNYSRNSYDKAGNLLSSKSFDSLGVLLTTNAYGYNHAGDVTNIIGPLGGITEKKYTSSGNIKFQKNPTGSTNRWLYRLDGRVFREFLPNGQYWENTYDDARRTVKRVFSGDAANVITTVYDRRGNVLFTTNAVGAVATNSYDGLDRIKITAGPSAGSGSGQQLTTYIYDGSGKTLTVSNALGERTVTTSDALGRPVTKSILNSSGVTSYSERHYYPAGQHSVTTVAGLGPGAITNLVYTDTFGKPVLGVLFATSGGPAQFTRSVYDSVGNIVSSQDELGQVTTFAYDGLGRAITTTMTDGAVVSIGYNAAGSITNRTMPGGLVWSGMYDSANRLVAEQRSHNGTVSITNGFKYYNSGPFAGLLQSASDGRAVVSSNSYDGLLRLARVDSSGPLPEHANHIVYTYDRRGLITQLDSSGDNAAIKPTATILRSYDAYGQITNEQVKIDTIAESDFNQAWDAARRRITLARGSSIPAQGVGAGSSFAYGYNPNGQLTSVSANSQNYTIQYALNGLPSLVQSPFCYRTPARDKRGRPTSLTTSLTAGAVQLTETFTWRADSKLDLYSGARPTFTDVQDYSYDLRGRLTNDTLTPSPSIAAVSTTYGFDATKLGVLTSITQSGGLANSWQSGTLDNLFRVVSEANSVAQLSLRASGLSTASSLSATLDSTISIPLTYPADADGRWYGDLVNLGSGQHTLTVSSTSPVASTNSVFTVYGNESISDTYDSAGNVTNRVFADGRVQSLVWDGVGRLVKVTEKNGTATNYIWNAVYDGLGRRLRTIYNPGGTNSSASLKTDSWFDPQVEYLEIAVDVNHQRTWKVYGVDISGSYGGMQGAGGLQATVRESDGLTYGVLNDYFGNAIASISGAAISWNPTRVNGYGPVKGYRPQLFGPGVPLVEATSWRGQRIDPTGFYWLGARYYEPVAARFLSPDPLGHVASLDLYSAFNGDPVNNFDPDGRVAGNVVSKIGKSIGWLFSTMVQMKTEEKLRNDAFGQRLIGNEKGANDLDSLADERQKAVNQNVQQVVDNYNANYSYYGDSHFYALNATFNPMVEVELSGGELGGDRGMHYYNSGSLLDYNGKVDAGGNFFIGGVQTVGLATGLAGPATKFASFFSSDGPQVSLVVPGVTRTASSGAGQGVTFTVNFDELALTANRAPVSGYTWNQVFQARYGAGAVDWVPPSIPDAPLTLGVLRTPAGDFDLASGWNQGQNGYAPLMPKGAPGFDIVTRTHVEGLGSALMQKQGINEGILYINNPEICTSCNRNLPSMLGPGRSLQVVPGNGAPVPYTGH